ncbi:2-(1,2-epoxy-1,2-dihydrophenyl)acetyl-CoA isomerase [Bradyrhizobium macuxiense]|uniref:2-(1,2-epoxy-1,2-dihydrophenyl)acetyl-CoA isomerase n=1 Tax=Bradyrhizobium macuxiense TaxID=1755647 RepID=A0A560LUQ7_9BRAD|nr:enoyl-CoA hydratase-related protein [Bradyrhizobium macuxiense]TWB98084.1 2-(1,2-epoxy-1,2-dihydrophenyl)acetyl-CoA isomerase [Bradyrhizobium macuxiense]
MTNPGLIDLARALYAALRVGDREKLGTLLHPQFVGTIADGMPFEAGGRHDGPDAMRRDGWGVIARNFVAYAEPNRFEQVGDTGLLVMGRYRGEGKRGGSTLDAAFAHLLSFEDGRIRALEQYTDTERWHQAASPFHTLLLEFADGVATLRLNRPEQGNAINAEMASDLEEAATRIAERSDTRAVLITGNGPNFTVGGDVNLFAGTASEELPNRLRRMIDDYHLALDRLMSIDAPVIAAVRGAAAGGGLGLVHVADIVIAADDARFALGYGALGLTSDGGNTWFLPRTIGLRRAQELFLLNRRLTAQEALEFGLVSRLVAANLVDTEAADVARKIASGPTKAYGAMRRMLRQSFETDLSDQLRLEKDSIVLASCSDDAREGIAAFAARRRPDFRGS